VSVPIPVIATAVLETMKLVQQLASNKRVVRVTPEFLEAQQGLVDAAADRANELDSPDYAEHEEPEEGEWGF